MRRSSATTPTIERDGYVDNHTRPESLSDAMRTAVQFTRVQIDAAFTPGKKVAAKVKQG